jgi:hypothetical protein
LHGPRTIAVHTPPVASEWSGSEKRRSTKTCDFRSFGSARVTWTPPRSSQAPSNADPGSRLVVLEQDGCTLPPALSITRIDIKWTI